MSARKKTSDPANKRITGIMIFCMFFATSVIGRAVLIQLIKDPRLESMARHQFQSKVLIRPKRGPILDRNGEPLAVNIETRSLAANPAKIQNAKTLARLLSKALRISYTKVLNRLDGDHEFVWIKRHLTEDEMNRLKKFGIINSEDDLANGFWMVKESKRVYPHKELAAHVLGDVNLDSEGLEGVELWQNNQLRGKVTSVSGTKDALGRPTFLDTVAAQHLQDGNPVGLTIDASLQYAVEQELHSSVTKASAKGGSVIVMNADNGEILAMANEPSFNPNDKGIPAARRRNRALTDGYEPGSTLKAVLLASALSHGSKLTDQLWGERGSFIVQGHKISEAEAHEKFEWTTLRKMIQVSSNVVAAKLALKIGAQTYFNTLKEFGFSSKTGTGFPGEISGRILPLKEWKPISLANIGFGQGILVTPLQMIRSYATFANGGMMVQPTLLRMPAQRVPPPVRLISEKVAADVVDALSSVTEDKGTGIKARLEGYQIAGKTGTAQAVDSETGKYSRSHYIASFIGFPVGIEPKLVVLTMIDEPKGVYYASETAAPLFKAVLNAAANRFSLPATMDATKTLAALQFKGDKPGDRGFFKDHPEKPSEKSLMSDKVRWSLAKVVDPATEDPGLAVQWQGAAPNGGIMWALPSLRGLTAREAIRALAGHKFQLEMRGNGLIKTQVPDAGKPIADGGTVKLTLAEP